MSLKDVIAADLHDTFLNLTEFAEKRTVVYNSVTYTDIPIVLTGIKEKDRRQIVDDHAQGLYLVTSVLHCAMSDIGGIQPEKGTRIRINDAEGGAGFYREFYVGESVVELGMLRCELEGIDE